MWKELDAKKTNGLDYIPCDLLRLADDIVAPSLTRIFNESILTKIVPFEWKLVKVTPIIKKSTRSDVNNYWSISVLPAVAKIYEKIIYDQVYENFNENCLQSNHQSGFRSLYSTVTALLEATNSCSVNIDSGLF